jgi:hypothetical protein
VTIEFQVLDQGGMSSVILGFYTVIVPFYGHDSKLVLEIRGVDPAGRERSLSTLVFEAGAKTAKETSDGMAVVRANNDPEFEDQVLKLTGEISSRAAPLGLIVEPDGRYSLHSPSGLGKEDVSRVPYIKDIRFHLTYRPNTKVWPDFKLEAGE